jgi:hypothetical protein
MLKIASLGCFRDEALECTERWEYPRKALNFPLDTTSGRKMLSVRRGLRRKNGTHANLRRAVAAVVLLLPALAFAHHALQAEFEVNKTSRRWTGILKSVQWVNPHSHFTMDVTDDNGKLTTWNFETASPNGLRRAGFSKDTSFELGKTYTVIGYAARDGSPIAFVEQLTLPSGRTVRIWFGDPNGSN